MTSEVATLVEYVLRPQKNRLGVEGKHDPGTKVVRLRFDNYTQCTTLYSVGGSGVREFGS